VSRSSFNPRTATVQSAFAGISIQSRIGSGGQKIVYHATHPKHGEIALKLVRPGSTNEKDRIRREVDIACELVGPGFARMHETGSTTVAGEDVVYGMEEYLAGQTLRVRLVSAGRLPIREVIRIGQAVLVSLRELEERRVVHRDVKPENIYLATGPRVVLLDLGIARFLSLPSLTQDHALVGPLTPGYAAPEQIRNQKRRIDGRTDLFALGVVLYECVAGENPFLAGCTAQEALERCLTVDPPRLCDHGVSSAFAEFVETCMQKHTSRRYASVGLASQVLGRLDH